MKRLIPALLLQALIPLFTEAQPSRIIRGTVSDAVSAQPLEGVQIIATGSKLSTGSQTDGIFSIPVTTQDSFLVFRFEEYREKKIRISDKDAINITLEKGAASPILNPAELIGNWRGLFAIRDKVEVPFQLTITQNGNSIKASLLNGSEQFPAGDVQFRDDSVFIPFPLFDNELALSWHNKTFSGVLRRQDFRGNATPVSIQQDAGFRFDENGSSPLVNLNGKYRVVFQSPNGKEETAVGLFKQEGKKLFATFLRVTGDARYLEGIVEDHRLKLSSFIGSSPAYYTATVDADGKITGETVNARGSLPFVAVPDASAELPDAYTLTKLKGGENRLQFRFPDAEGKLVSNTDAAFQGKPLIIAIGGTWCPNCIDEAGFLSRWYLENKKRGIEVIALQYERQTDAAFVKKAFTRFRQQFNIQYPLLLGGIADKQAVVASLPALENFISFPTTLFIDRNGVVQKIHTGFNGPATGKYYEEFIREFNSEADKLLR